MTAYTFSQDKENQDISILYFYKVVIDYALQLATTNTSHEEFQSTFNSFTTLALATPAAATTFNAFATTIQAITKELA